MWPGSTATVRPRNAVSDPPATDGDGGGTGAVATMVGAPVAGAVIATVGGVVGGVVEVAARCTRVVVDRGAVGGGDPGVRRVVVERGGVTRSEPVFES